MFDSIALALTDVDRYAAAAHFGETGMLDLQAWGRDVHAGRLAIAEALGKTLYITPRAADDYASGLPDLDVDVDQVFLGAREAVVRFDAHLAATGVPWMQIYAVGEDSVVSSRLYTEDLGHLIPTMRWTDAPRHPFYERYVDVWSSGDERRLAEVYAGGVVVRNALDGQRWVGLEELAEEIGAEDDRFDGSHTVILCFTLDEVASGWPNERWSRHAVHQGLHELAHVWMYDNLDEIDHLVFLRRVGLEAWRDPDVFWPQRGVEAAAETLAWGLAGNGRAEYLIEPAPNCPELGARYEVLTGTKPLTACAPAGGA